MKFINAYAGSALCTPSRTSFMTGRYPARTPVGLIEPLTLSKHDSTIGLTPDYTSLPALLKKGGYETYLAGKWHLGFMPAFNPMNNGYDEFFGLHSGAVDYISHTSSDGNNDLYENDKPVTKAGYMTDLILEKNIAGNQESTCKTIFSECHVHRTSLSFAETRRHNISTRPFELDKGRFAGNIRCHG